MSLATKLAPRFSRAICDRGRRYFLQDRVKILTGSSDGVSASVFGTCAYEVDMALSGAKLAVSCDCPYFESTGLCKHIWAAILAADASKHMSAAKALYSLDLIEVAPEESDPESEPDALFDLDDEDDPAEEEPWPSLRNLGSLLPAANHLAPASSHQGWRRRIQQIEEACRNADGRSLPEDREIFYIVEADASARNGGVVVSGIVRSQDVGPDNTVRSSAMADAEVRLEGRGTVSDRQRPGYLQRLFDLLGLF
jgi:hypothetical protein